ncbi:MAG: GNAT family N-acetyltransferase [Oscillospiraceae bacterium]|jgi:ribosomal protein S18 acetylase RimI-like enzyme|nr:GNAT family N-acetyltransferase [Oscillospiraceae bacterium]
MTEGDILRCIDAGAKFYLDFFGDAIHMDRQDNGLYTTIAPKDGEQGVRFVYDLRLAHLDDAAAGAAIAAIQAMEMPVWWGLSQGGDEFYMALLPDQQPALTAIGQDIRRVTTPADFRTFAGIANAVFAGGYGDIHPENHYPWCADGRMAAYIAYAQGKPVAVAAILNNMGACSLEFVATLPAHRRQGLAEAVCCTAIRDAFASGAAIITLRAADPARRLYEKLGFETYTG